MISTNFTTAALLFALLSMPALAQEKQEQEKHEPAAERDHREEAKPAKPEHAPRAEQDRPEARHEAQSEHRDQRAQQDHDSKAAEQQQRDARSEQDRDHRAEQDRDRNAAEHQHDARTEQDRDHRAEQDRDRHAQDQHSRVGAMSADVGRHEQLRLSDSQRQQQEREQHTVWQQRRAQHWESDHRDWRQRGGYNGYRLPTDYYREYYGPQHSFRVYSLPFEYEGGYPRYQYAGYWFTLLDPYPESWGPNWYQTDDCYIDYVDDGYYLFNRRYPGRYGIAISFVM